MWADLLWTLLIFGLVAAILIWGWSQIKQYIPAPIVWLPHIVGVVILCGVTISILIGRTHLIPCCQIGGVQLF